MGDRSPHDAARSTAVLVYDGQCGFCQFWVDRWRHRTARSVDFQPYQTLDPVAFGSLPQADFARAVHFFEPGGRASDGALAVARLMAWTGGRRGRHWAGRLLTAIYLLAPGAAWLAERFYRGVAEHRGLCMRATTLLWGSEPTPSRYAKTAWLFRRLLGFVYVLAFTSLSGQIVGLIGERGILPVQSYLEATAAVVGDGAFGLERFHALPTLCWLDQSDAFLRLLCAGGAGLGALLMIGLAPIVTLPILWLLYLSLVSAGGDFMMFQWDSLLLETGVLAACCAPVGLWDRWRTAPEPPRAGVWLFRWLLFRLVFGAGVIKLASGDPSWRNLTAVAFHYGTQPLPTPLAWYAAQLPLWFHRLCTASALAVQLLGPWLIAAPRRVRVVAGILVGGLELLVGVTGNYGFFNLLTLALCVFLVDDALVERWCGAWSRTTSRQRSSSGAREDAGGGERWRRRFIAALVMLWVPLSVRALAGSFLIDLQPWPVVSVAEGWLAPFRSINTYGLFARMTVTRPEIVIEGSDDGRAWRAYEFRYKAGDPARRPPWVAPHQPRVDWMMWFAALGSYDSERWFQSFCDRLLDGSPEVSALLDVDPFAGHPPRFLRATLYSYRFARRGDAESALWWVRDPIGPYTPVLSQSSQERLARLASVERRPGFVDERWTDAWLSRDSRAGQDRTIMGPSSER